VLIQPFEYQGLVVPPDEYHSLPAMLERKVVRPLGQVVFRCGMYGGVDSATVNMFWRSYVFGNRKG